MELASNAVEQARAMFEVRDGLPVCLAEDWGEFFAAADTLDHIRDATLWYEGALGAKISAESKYGEAGLEEFAKERGRAYGTLKDRVAVYKRMERLDSAARAAVSPFALQNLAWSHYREANEQSSTDEEFVAVLEEANDNEWTVQVLGNTLAQRRQLQGNHTDAPAPPEARYPVLGEVGGIPEEYQQRIAEKLDEMDDYQREKAIEAIRDYDQEIVADLAGVEWVSNEDEPDEAAEAERKWDAAWSRMTDLLVTVTISGSIAKIAREWEPERKQRTIERINEVKQQLERWVKELEG